MAGLENTALKKKKPPWLFPLPGGEGQGEGESVATTAATVYFEMLSFY
jgi:hypothetical protein